MNTRHLIILAAGLITLILPAGSAAVTDTRPVYTLEDCLRLGLERSALVANATRDAAIAEARVWQVRSEALPQFDLKGNYTRMDKLTEITFDERVIEVGSLNSYSINLGARQLLYSGGKVMAALEAARTARRYTATGIMAARAAMIRDITTAFHDVLLAQAAVDVRRDSMAHLQSMRDEAELKKSYDVASEFEVLSARVRLANERPLLIRAVNILDMARNNLSRLLSLPTDDFKLEGRIAQPDLEIDDLDTALDLGLVQRPELIQMQDLVEMRHQDLRAARGDWLPTVRASANYGASNPDQDSGFGSDESWSPRWNAGITAEWSLFDGGRRYGVIREKRLEVDKQQEDLHELTRNVRLEIRQAWLDKQYAAEAVQGSEENVNLAEKALAIAQVRFAQGLSTYLELTETNLALSTAQLARLQALRDLIHATARLRYACGLDYTPNE
ncbi:MAG: TolC family protein [Kiritimatiellia bacterium]|nr:TolC family protein [Lentisphaerota bacterium]